MGQPDDFGPVGAGSVADPAPAVVGEILGHYRIVSQIGRGGMGVVFQARDLKLGRLVALKTSRPDQNTSRDRRRFLKEARAAARLSHPHIAPIFEVFENGDAIWVVMELIEGRTLRATLAQAQSLPTLDVVRHAESIASALQTAHAKGVLHRDISPNNIMLTPDDRAILMDFGLAECFIPDADDESTTRTSLDVVAGTPAYMAPEQVLGKSVDVRSDLFSFGAVIYEMCAGRPAFGGSDRGALFDAILNREPMSISRLNYDVPADLERIVRKAIAKRPDERYQTALDVLTDLRALRRQLESGVEPERLVPKRSPRALILAAFGLAAGLAIVSGWWWIVGGNEAELLPTGTPKQITSLQEWEAEPALSPDGTLIAYSSDTSGNADIWLTDIQGGSALQLTDDPASDHDPNWFPDGSRVAFVSARQGRQAIWSVPKLGGAPRLVIDNAEDPAISPDSRRIAFVRRQPTGHFRVHVAPLNEAADAMPVTGDSDGLWDHRWPAWSPDGRLICYAAARDLWVVDASGGKPRRLTTDDQLDFEPSWSHDGQYVYFSSYRQGTLALWRVELAGGPPVRLTGGTGPERHPSISRDGARLAYTTFVDDPDIIVRDVVSGVEHRLPGVREENAPIVAPDGSAVAFASDRLGGRFDLWIQPLAAGVPAGAARRLTDHSGSVAQPSFSLDGKWIAYHRVAGTQRDIWIVATSGGLPQKFTEDPAIDAHPTWSPDGSQIAFTSDRSGALHLWIAPVKEGRAAGAARRITDGPTVDEAPSWSPDGAWIAFVSRSASGVSEVWLTRSDGQGSSRRLTTGANPGRVRWDQTSTMLFVSGQWGGESLELRKVRIDGGGGSEFSPRILLGSTSLPHFDFSQDGRWLVYARETLRGDIWLLDARSGSY